jgi:DamX protein
VAPPRPGPQVPTVQAPPANAVTRIAPMAPPAQATEAIPLPAAGKAPPKGPSREAPLRTRYTIQIIAAHRPDGLRGLIRQYGLGDEAWIGQRQRDGKPWYSLNFGQYADSGSAMAARGGLPAGLREMNPWVRPVPPSGETRLSP